MSAAYSRGFDAHTHLDFPSLEAELEAVCDRARRAGVGGWAVCAADPAHWDRVVSVAARTGGVALVGIHPWWAGEVEDVEAALASLPVAAGIGEIGLDRPRGHWEAQVQVLRAQLALARDQDLPVALHCVRAWPELLSILRRDGLPAAGGMAHAWAGPVDLVSPFVELGLHLSIGPRVLRDTAKMERAAAAAIPLSRLLLETDCPEAGAEPAELVGVAEAVAALRGLGAGELLRITGDTARGLLRIAPGPRSRW